MAHSIGKKGHNINSFININQIATEFIQYFYSTLTTTPQLFIDNGTLYQYTTFKYDGNKYTQEKLIELLDFLRQYAYNISKMEVSYLVVKKFHL